MWERDRTNDTDLSDLSPVILMRAVEVEPRLGEGIRVELHGSPKLAVEVQRGEGLVIGVSASTLRRAPLEPYLARIATGHAGVLIVGAIPDGFLESLPKAAIVTHVSDLASPDALYVALHGALERVELKVAAERRGRWLTRYRYELGELIEISRAISQERDIDRLLTVILEKSRFITGADAGSFYLLEPIAPGSTEKHLRFKLSQNDSLTFESKEFTVPLSTRSIAGAAAITHRPINIPDVYSIGQDEPFGFDPSFDKKVGYRTRSMIAMPMISAEDDVIGVIQLINKKRDPRNTLTVESVDDEVVPFDQRSEDLLATLASQAGIALENALLYDEIRRIFDGFVRASVQAIEQRDPTTSGHSLRVSIFSCGLAEALDKITTGPYKDVRFTRRDLKELEYASLLHDFGKIGVREEVLVKAKKLYPHQLDMVRLRFDYVRKALEAEWLSKKLEAHRAGAGASDLAKLDEELAARAEQLDVAWRTVQEANEPTVLKEGDFTLITELGQRTYVDACGHGQPLLSENEVISLQVTKGSLHDREIDEIRSHVVHTFDFLSRIPWGKSFTRIPEIAGSHHEKLNGRGYPKGLSSEAIPLPSKIMTIADIFDALTARDRPYKKAMPVDRALSILGFEVKDGHIDGELVRIFTEAEVFKKTDGDVSY
ncbi:MAG: GAF domain-containing protein [Myxococcota bacterium]|nr:GAF domain-containing protein [Myxococcota bacterium]